MKKNYFIVRNNDVENLLDGQEVPEEKLSELNDVLKYRTSRYGVGDEVELSGETALIEQGYYSITLSAAGFNNNSTSSKFVTDGVEKPIRSDHLEIGNDFTWERSQEIDLSVNENGEWHTETYKWTGTYSFVEDMLVLSLDSISYTANDGSNVEFTEDRKVPFFGVIASPIQQIDRIEDGEPYSIDIVKAVFLDDDRIDATQDFNFENVPTNGDPIVTGGTGQLRRIKEYIQANTIVNYVVGTVTDAEPDNNIPHRNINRNTILEVGRRTLIQQPVSVHTAVGGPRVENETNIVNNFGGMGGDKVQNSFDFWKFRDILTPDPDTDTAFVRVHFVGPTDAAMRDMSISLDGNAISNGDGNNRVVLGQIAEVYFTVDRDQELDKENSYLGDVKLSDLEDFTLRQIDNRRRMISFRIPIVTTREHTFNLNLATEQRKFYFAAAFDDNSITSIEITRFYEDEEGLPQESRREYRREHEDENGICRWYDNNGELADFFFHSGDNIRVEVTFTDEDTILVSDILEFYLDRLVGGDFHISRANNSRQVINFVMPSKDVLLFLKTEALYTLTVFINEQSVNLKHIDYHGRIFVNNLDENATDNDRMLPFTQRFTAREFVKFGVFFKEDPFDSYDEMGSRYFDLERDTGLMSEYANIFITDRERDLVDGYIPGVIINLPRGNYFNGESQNVYFLMPPRNLTFHLRDKDNGVFLTVEEDVISQPQEIGGLIYTFPFGDNNIRADFRRRNNRTSNLNEETSLSTIGDLNRIKILAGQQVRVDVRYRRNDGYNFFVLDQDFMRAQHIFMVFRRLNFRINDPWSFRDLEIHNPIERVDDDHAFVFWMPENDFSLTARAVESRHTLFVTPNESQFNRVGDRDRRIRSVRIMVDDRGGRIDRTITFHGDGGNVDGINHNIYIPIDAGQRVTMIFRFSDIYQRIDSVNLESQEPSMNVGVPGENHTPNDDNTPATINIPNPTSGEREFFQIVTFRMPRRDVDLDLRWEERLYNIYLDIDRDLYSDINYFDSMKALNIWRPGSGVFMTGRPSSPYRTYAWINTGANNSNINDVARNRMNINFVFRPGSNTNIRIVTGTTNLDEVSHWRRNDSSQTARPIPEPNNTGANSGTAGHGESEDVRLLENGTITDGNLRSVLAFNVPKSDMRIRIIGSPPPGTVMIRTHGGFNPNGASLNNTSANLNNLLPNSDVPIRASRELILPPGIYFMTFSGGQGGLGGHTHNRQSAEWNVGLNQGLSILRRFLIVLNTTRVEFGLGRAGGLGGAGGFTQGGGGGGGGGGSMIQFSQPTIVVPIHIMSPEVIRHNFSPRVDSLNPLAFSAIRGFAGRGGQGQRNRREFCIRVPIIGTRCMVIPNNAGGMGGLGGFNHGGLHGLPVFYGTPGYGGRGWWGGGWTGDPGDPGDGSPGNGFDPRPVLAITNRVQPNLLSATIDSMDIPSNQIQSMTPHAQAVINQITRQGDNRWSPAHEQMDWGAVWFTNFDNRHGVLEIIFIRTLHSPSLWG